jgi:hypothetical protein
VKVKQEKMKASDLGHQLVNRLPAKKAAEEKETQEKEAQKEKENAKVAEAEAEEELERRSWKLVLAGGEQPSNGRATPRPSRSPHTGIRLQLLGL